MSRTLILAALIVLGCAKKEPPAAPAEEPAPAAPAPEPAPEPPPAPEPQPEVKRPNTDLNVKIVYANGTSKSGRVTRIERTEDWYGDKGWTDAESDLTVTLEGKGTEKQEPWSGIASI